MFTGIIEELGAVRRLSLSREGARLEVSGRTVVSDLRQGDSIAVNGVCLTVIERGADWFAADVSAETLRRTSLKQLRGGARVNLERPLLPSSRLGGHLVQGHVDGKGRFIEALPEGEGWLVKIWFPPELARYLVEKGSVAVDGISLTIAKLGDDWFEIAIIPHTWNVTNLKALERGAEVNLEVDMIAKYVERMTQAYQKSPEGGLASGLTMEKLGSLGY